MLSARAGRTPMRRKLAPITGMAIKLVPITGMAIKLVHLASLTDSDAVVGGFPTVSSRNRGAACERARSGITTV